MTQLLMNACESLTMTGLLTQISCKKNGRVSKLRLQKEDGVYEIKASKYLRMGRGYTPKMNDVVELKVLKKMKAGRVKLKAFAIAPTVIPAARSQKSTPLRAACKLIQVSICQSSKCKKQGAQKLWAKIEKELSRSGQDAQVQLTASKCLGACKKGPVAKLPSGKIHTRLDAATVLDLIR